MTASDSLTTVVFDGPATVVFDLGGVVLSWDPRLPYEQVLPAEEVPAFLERIDFGTWNRRLDAGVPFAAAEAELVARFPAWADAVLAYRRHFDRSLTGMVPGTGAVVASLQQAGVALLGLTNWSAETFPLARRRFGLLDRFADIVVSGEERLAKPDPAIFRLLLERHALDPAGCVFVDDSPANVAAAAGLGLTGLLFTDAARLRRDLEALGLLPPVPVTGPLFHLVVDGVWRAATASGRYPWSSRDLTYERQGFVHLSSAAQVAGVRTRFHADVADDDLTVLELDLSGSDLPVVVEQSGGEGFPHLFAPLPLDRVVAATPWPEWSAAAS